MTAAEARRWLKLKTRLLIAACGGLDEASRACGTGCRPYSIKQLSRCQLADQPDFLPIDIVLCLEAYCGEPLITGAMAGARPSAVDPGEMRDELSDVVERGAALLARWRAMLADGDLDAAEALEMEVGLDGLAEEVRQCQAALVAARTARAGR